MKAITLLTLTCCITGMTTTLPFSAGAVIYTYEIPATANISSAGRTTPVGPGGSGAGTLPLFIPITPGAAYFTANSSGTIAQATGSLYNHGPDGYWGDSILLQPYGGISGFKSDRAFALTGVFLSDLPPAESAPATLDFRNGGIGLDFETLSPQIGQIFFIGDGVNSESIQQTFNIPSGATRLFLGYPDAPSGNGLPGAFSDNSGSLSVAIQFVPEPSVASLFLLGAAFMVRRFRRR